ncbi:putative MFS family arabinose efflux permease [Ciceribacter lividus]|uniref:Putative MFS family arabinose efflux permease n=1 Tax=Ciceribacter lividus TaxID=1197950 RepID=A0A6I7HS15_9HYPH|nr:MFS transporter [Ciceribacter lividus]RCW27532.1 putative MFS family arabinose efflux permease [Ciceribacter lividus]
MLASLTSIATLMLSTLLMMTGLGLMNYLVPLRALADGWSTVTVSVIATAYTLGFTLSCIVTPVLVRRVGHVRVFGALITLLTVSILFSALLVEVYAWLAFRALAGFAIAGSYLIIESWLNERVTNDNRGAVFSVYMITCLLGSIGGQYLVPLGDPKEMGLFVACGIVFSLALLPTMLSTAPSPAPIAEARFDLVRLYRRSPIAFVGSLLAGALSGTWGSLGGVYSQAIGMDATGGATLLAAVLAGGALAQMPIGRISDRIDRRLVMIACGLFGVAASLAMAAFGAFGVVAACIAGFFVGSVLYPVYALNAAHAADMAEPGEYVTVSGGVMILYGMGTVTGPLIGGSLMQALGPVGLVWFLAFIFAVYAGYAAWRMGRRRGKARDEKTDFQGATIPVLGADRVNTTVPPTEDGNDAPGSEPA